MKFKGILFYYFTSEKVIIVHPFRLNRENYGEDEML